MKHFLRNIAMLTLVALVLFIPSFASAAAQTNNETPDQLVRQIAGLAYEDQQTLNSSHFGLGDSLKKVEKEWGPSDDKGTVASNYYDHHILFLYDNSNSKERITAIQDSDPRLATISLSHVINQLGQPTKQREVEGTYEVVYQYANGYELLFIFESVYADSDPEAQTYIVRGISK